MQLASLAFSLLVAACATAPAPSTTTVPVVHVTSQAANAPPQPLLSQVLVEATLWASHTEPVGLVPDHSEPRRVRAVYESSLESSGNDSPHYPVTLLAFQISKQTYLKPGSPEYYWRVALDKRWISIGESFLIQRAHDDDWCLVDANGCNSGGEQGLFAKSLGRTLQAFSVPASVLVAGGNLVPDQLELPREWSARGVGLSQSLLATPVDPQSASRYVYTLQSEPPPVHPKRPPGTFGAQLQDPSYRLTATFTLSSHGGLAEIRIEHDYTLAHRTRSHVLRWRRLQHTPPSPSDLQDYELPWAPSSNRQEPSAHQACPCSARDMKCAMRCSSRSQRPTAPPPKPAHFEVADPALGEPPRPIVPAHKVRQHPRRSPLYVLPRL